MCDMHVFGWPWQLLLLLLFAVSSFAAVFGGKRDKSVACVVRFFLQAAALSAGCPILCPLGSLCESQSSPSLPLMSLSGVH